MAFSKINGIVVHHAIEGPEGALPLVFSNSLGTDFRIWDAVAADLAKDFRILRYDKRGHGLSEAPPAPYAMEDHVVDLKALIDYHGLSQAIVVGLSVGGMIAQGLAAQYPRALRALVLMDTAHRIGTAESWNDRIEAIEKGGIAALAGPILERWFTPAYRAPGNADFVGYANMLVRTPAAGYLGSCAALRDADYTKATAGLDLPTLCIVGDQDGSTPPDLVRSTAGLIAGSRFEVVEGAGHLPCIERPEAVVSLLRDFARSVSR